MDAAEDSLFHTRSFTQSAADNLSVCKWWNTHSHTHTIHSQVYLLFIHSFTPRIYLFIHLFIHSLTLFIDCQEVTCMSSVHDTCLIRKLLHNLALIRTLVFTRTHTCLLARIHSLTRLFHLHTDVYNWLYLIPTLIHSHARTHSFTHPLTLFIHTFMLACLLVLVTHRVMHRIGCIFTDSFFIYSFTCSLFCILLAHG